MQFIRSYTALHARTELEDHVDPAKRLHVARLWLKSFGLRRPTDPELFRDYEGVAKALERARAA